MVTSINGPQKHHAPILFSLLRLDSPGVKAKYLLSEEKLACLANCYTRKLKEYMAFVDLFTQLQSCYEKVYLQSILYLQVVSMFVMLYAVICHKSK